MFSQNKIIFFCYAYLVGIALAMSAPVDPAGLPLLRLITGLALTACALVIAAGLHAQRTDQDDRAAAWSRRAWWCILVASLTLGYTRYISANSVPDTRLGEVVLGAESRYVPQGTLPDTCRLRFQKSGPLAGDVRLRLRGELDARVPVRDDQGRATVDGSGRWRFSLAPLSITSDVITVRAADANGTDYVVPQPFTRLTGVDIVSGPTQGVVTVFRISNHISSFVRPGRAQSPVTILGQISADPLVYDFKTVLPVTPEYVQYPAGGPYFRVEGGDIQVTVQPTVSNYSSYARTEAYGQDVEFSGELTVARAQPNPGGFNARRFMQNYNVFGLVSLYQPRSGPPPIQLIPRPDGRVTHGNRLVEFSLALRDDVLRVIKQTVIFPHSAFIGGVTLGLRYGLQGVECMFSDRYRHVWQKEGHVHGPGCEETIADEFKEAGVNHVLAVSGLHVTIITAMLVGIFSMMRIPRQAYVPLIMLALVIFAIITGARPSTLRAVIMNSLFLMTWAYMDQSLRSSVLLGVPVAAFLILLHNPLVLVDPSFTLSFGAILSLGLLTTPSLDLLQRLKGNQFVLAVVVAIGVTWVGIVHWALLVTPQFLVPLTLLVVVLFKLGGRLQQQGIGISERINYGLIPEGMGAFFGAQFAIQLGMMIPLSVFYFSRWPFAGAYSNLIAIPLIGVNVQLGAIGGLLGLIPGVGIYLALLLGAANWFFSCVFLWLAHASSEWWPYPFIRRPGLLFVGTYYILCAWFIWRRPIAQWLEATCQRRLGSDARWPRLIKGVVLVAIIVPLLMDLRSEKPDGLRLQFLSVGYGSAVLVESPGGKRILVDAGFVEHERGRRNEAIRTVVPYLAYRSIRHLDGFIVSSPRPERAAGASHVLEHVWIDHVFVPPTLAGLTPEESFDAFSARFTDADDLEPSILAMSYEELVGNAARPRRNAFAPMLAKRGPTWANRWAGWDTKVQTVQAGQALFEEQGPQGSFRIEVLNPVPGSPGERSFDNGSLVLRVVYGDFAVLLTGDLQHDAEGELAARYAPEALRAQIMTIPHRGTAPAPWVSEFKGPLQGVLRQQLGALLDKVQPDRVIAEYGSARPVLGMVARTAQQTYELSKRFVEDRLGAAAWLSTDRDLAITITSDGRTYEVQTQAELNRAEGGVEDAVSDIAVGL